MGQVEGGAEVGRDTYHECKAPAAEEEDDQDVMRKKQRRQEGRTDVNDAAEVTSSSLMRSRQSRMTVGVVACLLGRARGIGLGWLGSQNRCVRCSSKEGRKLGGGMREE